MMTGMKSVHQTSPKKALALEIDALTHGAFGIGRHQGQAILVPATAPGDKIVAQIVRDHGRHAVGAVERIIAPGAARRVPPCPYVRACGGCPWQQIAYGGQLEAKQKNVADALTRIGRFAEFDLRPIVASGEEFRYRRRIRLQVDRERRLGFFQPASHRIVEVDSCLIAAEAADRSIPLLRPWVRELETPLESVEIVTGDGGGVVAVARAASELRRHDEQLCAGLIARGIQGLIVRDRRSRRTWGVTRISIAAEDGVELTAEADGFTQVHAAGNRQLVSALLAAGAFESGDRVLELYAGAGNFSFSIARRVREVVAVEAQRSSVEAAESHARRHAVDNILWLAEDAASAVGRLARRKERFSKIVLDPPRSGAKGIDRDLARLDANSIIYVSCHPATLARDLAALAKHGYRLGVAQPVDLFPQTFHVEVIARLTR